MRDISKQNKNKQNYLQKPMQNDENFKKMITNILREIRDTESVKNMLF